MDILAIVVIAFLAAFSLLWGLHYLLVPHQEEPSQALKRRLRLLSSNKKLSLDEISAEALIRHEELSSIGFLHRILTGLPRLAHLRDMLNKAGNPMNLGALLLLCATLGMSGIATGLALNLHFLSIFVGILLSLIPVFVLKKMKQRRMKAFEAQFPEAVELVTRALKAGHSFSAGLKMAASEMADPIKTEFGRTFEDYSYGKTMEHALAGMVSRVDLDDVKFFASAVNLQRETGGNLTELLENLGFVIRERFKLERTVSALSAEGRLSGKILASMPPGLFVMLWFSAPDYISIAIEHPVGQTVLGLGVAFEILGMIVINRLIKLDI